MAGESNGRYLAIGLGGLVIACCAFPILLVSFGGAGLAGLIGGFVGIAWYPLLAIAVGAAIFLAWRLQRLGRSSSRRPDQAARGRNDPA